MSRKGSGALFAVLLLLICELYLHTDNFLTRYRSIFAAGRLMDKLNALNELPVSLLLVGNSRTDNGFDSFLIKETTGLNTFNLGVPGANAQILYGVVSRLEEQGVFREGKVNTVLLGLDESIFQFGDSLGYGVFIDNRETLLQNYQFKELFSTYFRLLGYGDHLKELREPEKLVRFIKATYQEIEPMGGSAKINYGFRPGERDKFQNDQQLLAQEAGALKPPGKQVELYFWELVKLLKRNNVAVAVFFPPLLNRDTLFLDDEHKRAKQYIKIKEQLLSLGIPILNIGSQETKVPAEFANAGHLNRKGATRFSKKMSQELLQLWPNIIVGSK
ncbi:MAG: hypothetical protein methR_P2605 [Methyloprofundus sp.]|nr:MAG: hypothetical protein methR_P2605 [Methyloprofundus sp.]